MTLSLSSPAGSLEDRNEVLRVMTFNIRNSRANDGENRWANRRGLVANLIHAQKIDLLGVQEAYQEQVQDLREALPEYGEIGVGRDDGRSRGEHSQLFYRRERFLEQDWGTFWFSDAPELPGSKS